MTAHMHTRSITATIINSTITIITSTISYIDTISPLIIWSTKLETYTRNITKPFALSPPPRLLEVVSPKAQYLSTPLSAHRRAKWSENPNLFSLGPHLDNPCAGFWVSQTPRIQECSLNVFLSQALLVISCAVLAGECGRGDNSQRDQQLTLENTQLEKS